MKLQTVVVLMLVVGGLLVAGTVFRVQDYLLRADEAEVRHACRKLCTLRVQDAAGATTGLLGEVADAFGGQACAMMDDSTPLLLTCRDKLLGVGLTVADYRCVIRADALEQARACRDDLTP